MNRTKRPESPSGERLVEVIDGGVLRGVHWTYEIHAVGGEEGRLLGLKQAEAIRDVLLWDAQERKSRRVKEDATPELGERAAKLLAGREEA